MRCAELFRFSPELLVGELLHRRFKRIDLLDQRPQTLASRSFFLPNSLRPCEIINQRKSCLSRPLPGA